MRIFFISDLLSYDDKRFNAQKFEEQFYNAKGLKNVENTPADVAPDFETAKVLQPSDKYKAKKEEKTDSNDAALLEKLLSNSETKALLKALAKTL